MRSLLLSSLILTSCFTGLLSASCVTDAADPGCVHFTMRTDSAFNGAYTRQPSQSEREFLDAHFWRMQESVGSFDKALSWYPRAWAYFNAYGLHQGDPIIAQHPEWIMHDQYGNKLFIPYNCHEGLCSRYAGDFSNPGFRSYWIGKARDVLNIGYKGFWLDDVNLEPHVSDGTGRRIMPVDHATGKAMTVQAWEKYFADFLTEFRAAFPNAEIQHNSIWYAGQRPAGSDPYVQQEIKAADFINLERGVGDKNITDAGPWSLDAEFAFIDFVHSLGKSVDIQNYEFGSTDYQVAAYYLISNGKDSMSNGAVTPYNWPKSYDQQIGTPLGARYVWNGLLRRDFTNGLVLLNPPRRATVAAAIPEGYTNSDGTVVNSVTLAATQGVLLVGSLGSGPSTPVGSEVQVSACGAPINGFSGDNYFVGGGCTTYKTPVRLARPGEDAPQEIYQSKRTSNPVDTSFTYQVPNLTSGVGYHVRLYFSDDISTRAGNREFNVLINGKQVLQQFDIVQTAGGRSVSVVKDFYGVFPNSHNEIVMEFQAGKAGRALLNGFSILTK